MPQNREEKSSVRQAQISADWLPPSTHFLLSRRFLYQFLDACARRRRCNNPNDTQLSYIPLKGEIESAFRWWKRNSVHNMFLLIFSNPPFLSQISTLALCSCSLHVCLSIRYARSHPSTIFGAQGFPTENIGVNVGYLEFGIRNSRDLHFLGTYKTQFRSTLYPYPFAVFLKKS